MTKTIFNFSRPLTERARKQISDEHGANLVFCAIHIRLDLEMPIQPQIDRICREALEEYGPPDFIILPGLAIAAVYIEGFLIPSMAYVNSLSK